MKLPSYLETKPSGFQGLGQLPKHWEVIRGRFVMSVNPSAPLLRDLKPDDEVSFIPMEALGEHGGLNLEQTRVIADVSSGYTEFQDGDVVVAKITPCFENRKAALARGLLNGAAYGTTELHVLRAGATLDREYLFYVAISDRFRKLGESEMYGAGGQKRVPPEFAKDFPVQMPSIAEQQQIAAFLDWKTGQIDALMGKKKELLEKLKEKRIAVITQAVTQGLNPAAPLRDSGIPWLGQVPQHWEVKRIKFIGRVGNGSTPSRENPLYWDEGDYPWLNSSVVNQEAVTMADQFVTADALAECHLPIVQPPAVLIGITGEGKTRGMATTLLFEATMNQHLAYLKPDPSEAVVGFVRRVFDMAYPYLRSESDGGGSTKGAITCEQINELSIPVPSIVEQEAIAAYLGTETQRIDRLVEKVEAAIDRLTEYRAALITAATTGKIDVRGVVVPGSGIANPHPQCIDSADMKITLQNTVLQWARQRARLSEKALAEKFGKKEAEKWLEKIQHWESDGILTYSEAKKLAHCTNTAFGYLFLDQPPVEKLPIPDFRTAGSQSVQGMSTELLDVIYQSQRRQDWFRDYLRETGSEKLSFVGSFPVGKSILSAAESIRKHLAYHPSQCRESSLDAVMREFVDAAEAAGILVVRAGKVGNNTRRTLDPKEFRGFALVDEWAPLVFVNSADTKAAQIFTLAHELAHIWAGQSALTNLDQTYAPEQRVEVFCNAVAAEYLVPMADLKTRISGMPAVDADQVRKLRLHYRVSDLVIIRRLHDVGVISKATFKKDYNDKLEEYRKLGKDGRGNFHNSQPGQVGRRFGTALVASTLEGKTLYRDALSLLDMKKESSFKEFARNLHFPI